eukprot:6603650-Pyramimonas_sp.AAC.1
MPCLRSRLCEGPGNGWCHHGKGVHKTLQGKEHVGGRTVFKTHAKKTYPEEMCARLAAAIAASMHNIFTDADNEDQHIDESALCADLR